MANNATKAKGLLHTEGIVFFTVFSGPTEDLGRGLALSGPGESRHPDAVVGEGVQTVELQKFPLGFFGEKTTS